MSKILLVDDDEFVVEYLKTHLEEWGYGVVEARCSTWTESCSPFGICARCKDTLSWWERSNPFNS